MMRQVFQIIVDREDDYKEISELVVRLGVEMAISKHTAESYLHYGIEVDELSFNDKEYQPKTS